jgi:dienelactone hydrolase
MKKALTTILLMNILLSGNQIYAQIAPEKKDVVGSWLGSINVGGTSLRMVFNLKLNDKDSLTATADSPDQGAKNIPLGKVILSEDKFTIQAPLLIGEYTGIIKSDSTIDGTWTQRGQTFPLNIKKLKAQFVINRPQEPKPKFPYISEDITFANKKFNINLAGTLTMPEGEGPFTAVIMITGSGAQNRDEALMGHKPFLVISDWMTRHGIAVLRYDDRGVGKSQGNYATATSADLATDAQAAFEFLKANPKINPGAIGLMGHSEGGLIAPIVAASNPEIAFIVSLAGPGVTGEEILYRQQADIGRLSGVNEKDMAESHLINKQLYSILKKEKDNTKAEEKVLAAYNDALLKKNVPDEDKKKALSQLKATFGAPTYTWFRYFILADPAKFWKKVKCPVLALNGEKDLQVAADDNLPAIEKALKSAGNKNIKTVKLPELNHLFQHCKTGLPAEYGMIEETFSPGALQIISDWISGLKVSH